MEPIKEEIDEYFNNFYETIPKNSDAELAILGPQQIHLEPNGLDENKLNPLKPLEAFQEQYFSTEVFV